MQAYWTLMHPGCLHPSIPAAKQGAACVQGRDRVVRHRTSHFPSPPRRIPKLDPSPNLRVEALMSHVFILRQSLQQGGMSGPGGPFLQGSCQQSGQAHKTNTPNLVLPTTHRWDGITHVSTVKKIPLPRCVQGYWMSMR